MQPMEVMNSLGNKVDDYRSVHFVPLPILTGEVGHSGIHECIYLLSRGLTYGCRVSS